MTFCLGIGENQEGSSSDFIEEIWLRLDEMIQPVAMICTARLVGLPSQRKL